MVHSCVVLGCKNYYKEECKGLKVDSLPLAVHDGETAAVSTNLQIIHHNHCYCKSDYQI